MEVLLWKGSPDDAPAPPAAASTPSSDKKRPAPSDAEPDSKADAADESKKTVVLVAKKKKTGSTKAKDKKFDPYVTEINNNDVLCYRGSGPNDHPGNKGFLALVNTKKKEYLATSKRRMKSAIAQTIINTVRLELVPPGRFLKLVDGNELVEAGYRRQDRVWKRVDDATALEKAKQALREKYVPIAFGGGRPGSKAKASASAQAEATAKAVEAEATKAQSSSDGGKAKATTAKTRSKSKTSGRGKGKEKPNVAIV